MTVQLGQQTVEMPWSLLTIPAFPTIATKALQLLNSEDTRLLELYHVIESDAAFSTEVLRIANSPLCALAMPVKTLTQAAMLLGFERLRGAAVTIGIRSYLGDLISAPGFRACWRHSLACAVLCEQFARTALPKSDEAYTAGTLHDIGRIVLATVHPKRYSELLEKSARQAGDPLETERELFGIDHCEAGRLLVTNWNLPEDFIEITACHHDKGREFELTIPTLVRLACGFADALGFAAVKRLETVSCEQLLEEIPEAHRHHFTFQQEEMAQSVKQKITALESM